MFWLLFWKLLDFWIIVLLLIWYFKFYWGRWLELMIFCIDIFIWGVILILVFVVILIWFFWRRLFLFIKGVEKMWNLFSFKVFLMCFWIGFNIVDLVKLVSFIVVWVLFWLRVLSILFFNNVIIFCGDCWGVLVSWIFWLILLL